MECPPRRAVELALVLALTSPSLHAQGMVQPSDPPNRSVVVDAPGDLAAFVQGTVVDMSPDKFGRLLYCTLEGEVGAYDPATRSVTVLADTTNGLPAPLVAVAGDAAGNVILLEDGGDVYALAGGNLPVFQIYDDLYMIHDATDLVVDAQGNYLIASRTPSSGTRGTNFVSPDGQRWDYMIVEHSPLQLAADPLTGDIFLVDQDGGGALRMMSASDNTHPTTPLDVTTQPGPTVAADDGDLAVENDGDAYWIAGGDVWKYRRDTGTTSPFASGYDQLRAAGIAPRTGNLYGRTPWSLYVAEGENPTRIREIANVRAPAIPVTTGLGYVPSRGTKQFFTVGMQVYEMTADNQGRLLLGGDLFKNDPQIRRYDPQTDAYTVLVDSSHFGLAGMTGTIEGIVVAQDDTVYAMERSGDIYEVTENPFSVTKIFSDPMNNVTAGKDMVMDVDGTFYIADRDNWGIGEVVQVSGGVASTLVSAIETRGLAADPSTGGLFVSEWNCTGFCGSVGLFDWQSPNLVDVPGFSGMNYTNDFVWPDGDLLVSVFERIYALSEDDWSLVLYYPTKERFRRVGSSYLDHPSGLAIAPSSPGINSPTGFSLYVSEFNNIWEKGGVNPAASPFVDNQAAQMGVVVGTIPPRLGRPRDLTPDPAGSGVLITTSEGTILRIDGRAASPDEPTKVELWADRLQGLEGDLTSIAERPDGRLVVASREGRIVELDPRRGLSYEVLFEDAEDRLTDVRRIEFEGPGRLRITEGSAEGSKSYALAYTLAYTFEGPRLVRRPAELGVAPLAEDADVAVDRHGNTYLSAPMENRVLRIEAPGRTGRKNEVAILSGGFRRPTALALSNGSGDLGGERLFVLDGFVVWAVDTSAGGSR